MEEAFEAGPEVGLAGLDPGGGGLGEGQDLLEVAGALLPDIPEDQQHAMGPPPPPILAPLQPAPRMESTQSGLLLRHASQSSLDESSQKIGNKVGFLDIFKKKKINLFYRVAVPSVPRTVIKPTLDAW